MEKAKLTQEQVKSALVSSLKRLISHVEREDVKVLTSSISTDIDFFREPVMKGGREVWQPVPDGHRTVALKVEMQDVTTSMINING